MVRRPEQAMDEALDAARTALQSDGRSWAAQVRATARLVAAAGATAWADGCFVELLHVTRACPPEIARAGRCC